MINTVKDYEKLSEQYNKMLEERNSLIDDLTWYRAKVSRLEQIRDIKDSALKGADIKIKTLERENECEKEWFYKYSCELEHIVKHERDTIKTLERENKALRIQSNTYFDEWQEAEKQRSKFVTMLNESNSLLSEISQHIGNKPSSSTYKYFRAKLDNLNITEDK